MHLLACSIAWDPSAYVITVVVSVPVAEDFGVHDGLMAAPA